MIKYDIHHYLKNRKDFFERSLYNLYCNDTIPIYLFIFLHIQFQYLTIYNIIGDNVPKKITINKLQKSIISKRMSLIMINL